MTSLNRYDGRRRSIQSFLIVTIITAVSMYTPLSNAGATFKIDETKWISIGAGLRTSFSAIENGARGDKWTNDFNLDNLRLYLNAQLFGPN